MPTFESLDHHLRVENSTGSLRPEVRDILLRLATATCKIARRVAAGPLRGETAATGGSNVDGDAQKELDIVANDLVLDALRDAPVACVVSEELPDPMPIRNDAELVVAVDPLDGSSNLETNASVGTIFSIYPAVQAGDAPGPLAPGNTLLAAGYCIYGPQTSLVLSTGTGTHIFTRDPDSGDYCLTSANVAIPEFAFEFAINMSNFRHWYPPIKRFVDDCLHNDIYSRSYNMRWIASLVAECHRILVRGGTFLYPADRREGYIHGRLRLLYECNPIAFLVEQAGGSATTGHTRILDIVPERIHQRVPLIFGSKREVERAEQFHRNPLGSFERSQLFGNRGLFRT